MKDDEDMMHLVESVQEHGILVPAILREKENGRFELIAGHRRKRACQLAGTYTKTSAVFALPDTRNLYDVKVRAYRTVKGKKVYGLFSDVISYSFDWDADMLKEAGEAYLLKTYPGITLDDTLSTGVKKNPWDGFTSWSALWPASYCRYQSWDVVKADLEETIRLDMENYGNALDYMCMWIEPEDAAYHEENWMSIWMLN